MARLLLRLILPMLAWVALTLASKNLTAYLPECAQPCIESSISQNSHCTGPDDAQCLCSNIRYIGPGSVPCAQGACSGNSTEQLTNKLHSGFLDYCSDNGVKVGSDFTGGGHPPVWTASWGWPSSPTASATSMTSPAAATAPADAEQQTSNSGGGGGGLSGGAIAGLAVGVGVACILITGALLLYAFRLGKRRSKHSAGDEPTDPGPQGEGGSDKGDPNGIGIALGTEDKVQLEGAPVSELPTEHTLSGFHPVKELATHEKPIELSADPILRRPDEGSPILPTPWR
ncbi:hypothetical protein F4774DRAFT_405104 [Daldinia eschscholtzii]|nr:hypothetical protein F4774DRAFT_405104 [Daldinia eschscholtzii]